MSETLFFTDIDPNQGELALDAKTIRRIIMSRLLIWDSIVVSDSQILQDPRFRVLMEPSVIQSLFISKQHEDERFDNLDDWQRGFEHLLSSGLVEIACRNSGDGVSELSKTWAEMNRSVSDVPFLPKNAGYAKYLEKIHYKTRSYSLSNVANRFKNNLQTGVAIGSAALDSSNPAHHAFEILISAEKVQLRDVLQLLNERVERGELSIAERDRLYQFAFQCYIVNVPAEINSYISAKMDQIPLFLSCGTYDGVNGTCFINPNKVRRSWAIDPKALDLLPLQAFVDLRKQLQEEFGTGLILKERQGNLQSVAEANEFYDVWDSYVEKLEGIMRSSLRATRNQINEITRKDYTPAQIQLENAGRELVINIVAQIPGISKIHSADELMHRVQDLKDSIILFNQRQAPAYFTEYHDEIQYYLDYLFDRNASIITKY